MKRIRRKRKKRNLSSRNESKIRRNTRSKFICAARKQMAEYGYKGATIRAICQEAGYSNGALYNYFDDKEHLFREVFQTSGREFINEIREFKEEFPQAQLEFLVKLTLKHKEFMYLFDVDTCIRGRETALFLLKFKNCIRNYARRLNAEQAVTSLQLAAALLRSPAEGVEDWLATLFIGPQPQPSLLAA